MNIALAILFFLTSASANSPITSHTEYYSTGERQAVYVNDGNDVSAMFFYKGGSLQETGKVVNQKFDGVWKQYDINGNQIAEAQYSNGIKTGTWKFWYGNGQQKAEIVYQENTLVSSQEWDALGVLVSVE